MIKLAILASGSGSNAEVISNYFNAHPNIQVALICSNKEGAGVLDRAQRLGIPSMVFGKSEMNSGHLRDVLLEKKVDGIILAGFLLKVPSNLIESYPSRIINIHPALLPKYGGKGMYGNHVHEAVIAAREKESGISIHLVNEHYDDGAILFQEKVVVEPDDNADSLAQKIHALEHQNFPRVIENYFSKFT